MHHQVTTLRTGVLSGAVLHEPCPEHSTVTSVPERVLPGLWAWVSLPHVGYITRISLSVEQLPQSFPYRSWSISTWSYSFWPKSWKQKESELNPAYSGIILYMTNYLTLSVKGKNVLQVGVLICNIQTLCYNLDVVPCHWFITPQNFENWFCLCL